MTHIHCKITGQKKNPSLWGIDQTCVYVSKEPFLFWIVDSDCERLI